MTFEELKKVVEEDSLKFIPTKNNKTFISVKEIEIANHYFDKVNQKEFNEDVVKEVLGRQWKHCLKSLTPLIIFLSKQSRKRPTEISCYLFKDINADTTCRNIGKLIKLDIIRCVQKHYSKDASLARIYQVNWFRFDLFYLIMGRSDDMREIEEYDRSNSIYKVNDKEEIENVIDEMINEDEVVENDKNFGILREYLNKLIKRQNELQSSYEFRYYLRKGAGRPYAPICSLPTLEKHKREEYVKGKVFREDAISSYFAKLGRSDDMREIEEYDRSNSIYKVNDYVVNKRIRENDRSKYDLYLKICGKPELRESVKVLVMTLYFSDARKFRSLCTNYFAYYIKRVKTDGARIIAQKGKDRVEAVINILGLHGEINIDQTIDRMVEWYKNTRELLKKEIGEFVGRSIFLYEAIVNLSTEIALLEKGYFCVSVYDGFYTNASEEEWWECYCSSLKRLNNLEGEI